MPTISLVPNYKTRDYKYDVLSLTLNKKNTYHWHLKGKNAA